VTSFFQPWLDNVRVVLFAIYLRRLISCSFISGSTFPIIIILISAGRCSSSYGILGGKKKCFDCYLKNCQTCNVSLQKLIFSFYFISINNVSLTFSLTFRYMAPESFLSPFHVKKTPNVQNVTSAPCLILMSVTMILRLHTSTCQEIHWRVKLL